MKAHRGPSQPRQGVPDDHRSRDDDPLEAVTKERDDLIRKLAAEKNKSRVVQKAVLGKQGRRERHQAVNNAAKDTMLRVAGRRDQEPSTHDNTTRRRGSIVLAAVGDGHERRR